MAAATWIPERDPRKHSLDHFARFVSTLRLPDGGGRMALHDTQLCKLEDYFDAWGDCPDCARDGSACVTCGGGGLVVTRPGAFENVHLEPTGAGKSTLNAALALHHCAYVRTDPRVYVLGGLGDHARNTMEAAEGFIVRSADLSSFFQPTLIGLVGGGGTIRSLHPDDSRDAGIIASSAGRRVVDRAGSAQEGKAPTLILVEETHRAEDEGVALATLTSKVNKRSYSGPPVQIVHVTTAGSRRDSVLGRLVDRATDVEHGASVAVTQATADALEGDVQGARVDRELRPGEFYRRGVDADGDLVVHEWAVPDRIQPPTRNAPSEELAGCLREVKRANPMPMVTVAGLRRTYRANAGTPWVFLRQSANQWVTQDFAAIDAQAWRDCGPGARRNRGRRLVIPSGRQESCLRPGAPGVYVGLDTAGKWDRTAIVPAWVDPESRRPLLAGAVILGDDMPPDPVLRARRTMDVLAMMRKAWPNMVLVFDRNYGGGHVAGQFESDGMTVVDFNQTGKPMELASMLLGELVSQQEIDHDGHPVLEAHVTRAVARETSHGTRWRFERPRDGSPVDGAVAAAMAVQMAMNPPEPERRPIDVSSLRIRRL
jgi:hypothetical protein